MHNSSLPVFNYSAFEDSFRGSREEIKEKLAIYLPLVKQLAPDSEYPVLDIACGRGEWLELIKEHGYPAIGIDINNEFVLSCLSRGLRVQQSDLFDFLINQSTQRYKLITGFHIIEHVPFDQQQKLLKLVLSLLAPDGVLIFETPNPENVIVGSCNFYIDPTHIRPVPAQLLLFLAQQANFGYSLIAKVNRFTIGNTLHFMQNQSAETEKYNQFVEFVSSRLFQAPDYALIAFKSKEPDNKLIQEILLINDINDTFEAPVNSKDELRALLWDRDQEILTLSDQLRNQDEEIRQAYNRIREYEKELASVYNTAAGQFIKHYKSFKKKLKDKKTRKHKTNIHIQGAEYDSSPGIPKTVQKVYNQLQQAFEKIKQ